MIGNGERALVNANIDSKDAIIWFTQTPGMAVNSKGYHSGSGANVYCREGTECTIQCEGTGCYNMNVYCYYGSECIIEPPLCGDNQPMIQGVLEETAGIKCPRVYRSNEKEQDEVLGEYIAQREILRINELDKWLKVNDEFQHEERYRIRVNKEVKVWRDDKVRKYYNNLDGILAVMVLFILVFIGFCAYSVVTNNINNNRSMRKQSVTFK